KLGAHDQRHQAADQEEEERRDQVQVTDDLVIGRGEPVGKYRALAVGRGRGDRHLLDSFERGHCAPPEAFCCACCAWIHWRNWAGVTILSVKSMRLWYTPQSSVQRPMKVPVLIG